MRPLTRPGVVAVSIAMSVLPFILSPQVAPGQALSQKTLIIPAVSFTAQEGGNASRVESLTNQTREFIHFWYTPGHSLEWAFDCEKEGACKVSLAYVAKIPARRSLALNGKIVPGLESFTLPPTSKGKWQDGWQQWGETTLPVSLNVKRGRNTIRMTCLDDTSICLSEIVLAGDGMPAISIPAARFTSQEGGKVQIITPATLGAVGSRWRECWKDPGHWVEWEVEVPAAGRYALGLHYRADGYCRLQIDVNGEKVEELSGFIPPKTGGLDNYTLGTLPVPLTLKKGKNTLRVTTLGGDSRAVVRFDGMFALSALHLTPLGPQEKPSGNLLELATMEQILASLPSKEDESIKPAALGPALAKMENALPLEEGAVFTVAGKKATVVKADVLPYVENQFSTGAFWAPYDDPKLKTIRDTYKLDDVVASGKTELEKQTLLMRWIWDQWDFGHAQELYNLKDPLWILRESRREHVFQCMHSGSVMLTAMAAMGWVCRLCGHSTHTWNEVWSNQYGRWVMMDATSNIWHERNGVPLSSYEYYHGRYVELTSDIVTHARDNAIWRLEPKKGGVRMSITNASVYVNDKLPGRGGRFEVGEGVTNAFDVKDLYYPVNQAALALVPEGDAVKVTFGTMTPNFKEFQYRVDGGNWQVLPGTNFLWRLHQGDNRLEARSVNLFGVEGHISAVSIRLE